MSCALYGNTRHIGLGCPEGLCLPKEFRRRCLFQSAEVALPRRSVIADAANSIDNEYYEERFHAVIDVIMARASLSFSPAEQSVYNSIDFILIHSAEIVARGSMRDGKRIVEISTGFLATIENL